MNGTSQPKTAHSTILYKTVKSSNEVNRTNAVAIPYVKFRFKRAYHEYGMCIRSISVADIRVRRSRTKTFYIEMPKSPIKSDFSGVLVDLKGFEPTTSRMRHLTARVPVAAHNGLPAYARKPHDLYIRDRYSGGVRQRGHASAVGVVLPFAPFQRRNPVDITPAV